MAKRSKTRKQPPGQRHVPTAIAVSAPPPKPERPDPWTRFWAYELSWLKWRVFRFAFFTLLAIDAFLQMSHAPRYGAGGFNVQHLPGAPLPEPGRASITFVHAALCLIFGLIAQGVLPRLLLPLATTLYGWAYFSSQLDAYQHHYLVWLLLLLACFVPRAPDGHGRITSWAVRLILVQLAIVYLWAAISKMTPLWLDGSALFIQVADGDVRELIGKIGFGTAAKGVLLAELALAATVWWRAGWPAALALGIGLHVGVELVGLEIGLFSYLMFAVYLLVVPDSVFVSIERGAGPWVRARLERVPRLGGWLFGMVMLATVAIAIPLPFGLPVALGFVLLVGAWASAPRDRLKGWAFGLAALVPLAVDARTETAADYYRYWAGTARRMENQKEARRAYNGLLEVDPSSEYAHYHLGNLERAQGNLKAALDHYTAARKSAAPGNHRAAVAEAEVRAMLQRVDGAMPLESPTSIPDDQDD